MGAETSTNRKQVTSMSIQQNARFTSLDNEAKKIMMALLANNEALLAGIEKNFNILGISVHEEHAKTRDLLKNQAEDRHRRKVELHILESLHFETMTHRYETISEAHQHTFEWIFRDPAAAAKPWSSFIQWAESGGGIYWINGKAGSGKSTLMRFTVDDPRTRTRLEQWASRETLDIPAFFFWNSGVPEQRSQVGLLRSILHNVLMNHTDLFPEVFPEEWRKALELSKHGVPAVAENWSLSRLQRSFKRLVTCASEKLHFCFFIDGLDEYDGDYEEISNYFAGLSNLPYVKFCIASRPLIAFKDAFSTFPTLKLQDLTSDDISHYIDDKLNGNKRTKLLTTKDPDSSERLVSELVWKAEGVFLWVALVVASLLKGLSQRDGIQQLRKRLDACPSDLELLYGHMFSLIDPIYMEESAILLQIYKTGAEILGPIAAESCYVAYTVDLRRVFGTLVDDLGRSRNEEVELLSNLTYSTSHGFSIYVCQSLLEYMDDILRTRCGGLLELRQYSNGGLKYNDIHYLHRTVKDYLSREDVWKDICRHNAQGSVFDPKLQLLMSYVLRLKRLLLFDNFTHKQMANAINGLWDDFCTHSSPISPSKSSDSNIQCRLLNEFDRVATDLSHRADAVGDEERILSHWSAHDLSTTWESDLLCEAIRRGLFFYVETRIISNVESVERVSGLPLIGFAFLETSAWFSGESRFRILDFLQEQGADPNEVWEGYTMWQYFIHCLHTVSYEDLVIQQRFWPSLKKNLKRLLENFMKEVLI